MIGWKIYFIIALIISVYSIVFYTTYETMRILDIVNLIICIISLFGLFGFCWSKKFLKQQFWKIFFIVSVVWDSYYLYFAPMLMSQFLFAAIVLILNIPFYVALYLYSFRKVEIWNKENKNINS